MEATEWLKPMVAGETIAFPAPGNSAMTPVTYFRITNTGAAQLNISSINMNSVAFLVTPGSTSLAPNQSGDFYISYINNTAFMSIVNAQVTINNNASSGAFTFNIKGAPGDLYGPMYLPYGTITTDSNGMIGRPGGRNLMITNVSMGTQTGTFWGPQVNQQQ